MTILHNPQREERDEERGLEKTGNGREIQEQLHTSKHIYTIDCRCIGYFKGLGKGSYLYTEG